MLVNDSPRKEFTKHTICPAPITPSFFTSAAALIEAVPLKLRHCCFAKPRNACLEAAVNDIVNFSSEEKRTMRDQHVKLKLQHRWKTPDTRAVVNRPRHSDVTWKPLH
jgi:hypothetical protein